MTDHHFDIRVKQSFSATLLGVSKAAYTVFMVPEHDSSIYKGVAVALRHHPQSIQLPWPHEIVAVRNSLKGVEKVGVRSRVSSRELLGYFGVLMQFLSYLPELRPYAHTPFEHIEQLYESIVKEGQKQPLGFSRQLEIALELTKGDLPEALWRLFITSRLYARWFDVSIISNMPDLAREEVERRMTLWSKSLKACKVYGSCPDQDTSGDTYYCWTHALARVIYGVMPARRTVITHLEALALRNGTRLNHGLAHKFKPQRLPSDHTTAAMYGNAIGGECIEVLRASFYKQ